MERQAGLGSWRRLALLAAAWVAWALLTLIVLDGNGWFDSLDDLLGWRWHAYIGYTLQGVGLVALFGALLITSRAPGKPIPWLAIGIAAAWIITACIYIVAPQNADSRCQAVVDNRGPGCD